MILRKLIFVAVLIIGCSDTEHLNYSNSSDWEEIDITFETKFELGVDSSAYLSHPRFVATDSKNNIFVADRGRNKLLLFNQRGELIQTIGKRGPGPEEFRYIAGLNINEKDKVIVFDRSSQTIKKFNTNGEYIDSYNLRNPINDIVHFEKWGSYNLLFYTNYYRDNENKMLHIYSEEFELIGESYISIQELKGLNKSALLWKKVTTHPLVTNNKMYFTPAVYNGTIYEYDLIDTKDNIINLILAKTIPGLIEKFPIRVVSGGKLDRADATITNRSGEVTQVFFHSLSMGLYKLKNGNIAHFTYIENKEGTKRTFGVELYDNEMNRLGYGKILEKELSNSEMYLLGWDIVWKDEKDRFYVIDRTGDLPKVRVMELEINKI